MRADAKANPKANDIASFCMRMTKFRLGSSYKLEVTDKRVPEKQAIAGSYTIVGTAKKEDETLSFVCKADYDAKNHTTLKELKLYQVKAIPQKSSKQ